MVGEVIGGVRVGKKRRELGEKSWERKVGER